jgi:glycosyltransferase involved in cell wall biosynthesis
MSKKTNEVKVSVIVCAFNEENHLGQTISDLLKCPTAQEIIVINDGSTDKTEAILKGFGKKIKLISYRRNRGKGHALYCGLRAAKGEVVVFLDAHLKNLKDKHLQQLTQPILKRKTNYVLGHYKMKVVKTDFFANITGQRAYLKQILIPYLHHLKKTRFGVETYLNEIFKPRWGKKIYLPDLVHLVKSQKMSLSEALPAYLQEVLEISKTKVEIRVEQHKQLQKILNPKKIKSIKMLRLKLNEIKDKEVSDLIKNSILPRLKKLTR